MARLEIHNEDNFWFKVEAARPAAIQNAHREAPESMPCKTYTNNYPTRRFVNTVSWLDLIRCREAISFVFIRLLVKDSGDVLALIPCSGTDRQDVILNAARC